MGVATALPIEPTRRADPIVAACPARWDVLAYLRAIRDSSLDAREKLIASVLALRTDGAGRCYPSVPRIASDAGMKDERAIRAAIAELALRGFVAINRKAGASNTYQLRCPVTQHVPPASDAPTAIGTIPPASNAVGAPDAPTTPHAPPASDVRGASDAAAPPASDAPPPPASDAGRSTQVSTQVTTHRERAKPRAVSEGSGIPADHPSSVRPGTRPKVPIEAPPVPTKNLMPAGLELTQARREVCTGICMTSAAQLDVELEWGKFKSYQIANVKESANWDESWSIWLRNAVGFERGRRRSRAPSSPRVQPAAETPSWDVATPLTDEDES